MGKALKIPRGEVAGHHPGRDSHQAKKDRRGVGKLGAVSLPLLREEAFHLTHRSGVVEADVILKAGEALQDRLDPFVVPGFPAHRLLEVGGEGPAMFLGQGELEEGAHPDPIRLAQALNRSPVTRSRAADLGSGRVGVLKGIVLPLEYGGLDALRSEGKIAFRQGREVGNFGAPAQLFGRKILVFPGFQKAEVGQLVQKLVPGKEKSSLRIEITKVGIRSVHRFDRAGQDHHGVLLAVRSLFQPRFVPLIRGDSFEGVLAALARVPIGGIPVALHLPPFSVLGEEVSSGPARTLFV